MTGKKTRDTSRKRESILDAAQQAFVNDGFDNTSMDRIAELAGASKRTVYNHFPSKEALFSEVLERFAGEAVALKQIPYDPKRSLAAQLGEFLDVKAAIAKNPGWLGLMRVTMAVFIGNPELAKETLCRAEDEEDTLVTWLKAAVADGRMKVPRPKVAADAFWAMAGGAFFWPVLFTGPLKTRDASTMRKELVRIFLARYAA